MVHEIEAESNLVSALRPACIGIEGVRLVVSLQRVPAFGVAERGIIGTRTEGGKPAFERVGTIGSGYPERAGSEIGAQVRRLHVLANSSPAEVSVNQEGWRDGIGLSDA